MSTKTVAELIDELFKTHLREDGQEYTYQDVSTGTGGKLDAGYIWKLRNGRVKNPGREALLRLCLFFRVPSSYFYPELTDILPVSDPDDQLQVALRDCGLSVDDRLHVQDLIKRLRRKQS